MTIEDCARGGHRIVFEGGGYAYRAVPGSVFRLAAARVRCEQCRSSQDGLLGDLDAAGALRDEDGTIRIPRCPVHPVPARER